MFRAVSRYLQTSRWALPIIAKGMNFRGEGGSEGAEDPRSKLARSKSKCESDWIKVNQTIQVIIKFSDFQIIRFGTRMGNRAVSREAREGGEGERRVLTADYADGADIEAKNQMK